MKEKKTKRKVYFSIYGTLAVVVLSVILVLFLFKERVREREYDMQIETIQELANQGNVIVESKLSGYQDVLRSLAEFLPCTELHSEENLHHLQHAVEKLDFQRIGIADLDGNSMLTDGRQINIKDRAYFQKACENQSVITGQEQSRLIDKPVFFVAEPIKDEYQTVKGVLYGVVELDQFRLYEDTRLATQSRYIQIIDREGRYIVKEYEKNLWENESAFDIIRQVKTTEEAEKIIGQIKNGEPLLMEMSYEGKEYMIYYSPIRINDWYVMIVMDRGEILGYERKLWGTDLFWMMFFVIGAVAVLAGVIILRFRKEQKEAVQLYQEQKLNEEILHQALLNSDTILVLYDYQKDTVRFLSRENLYPRLPLKVEHARTRLVEYLPENALSGEELGNIFQNLETMEENGNFMLSVRTSKGIERYRLRIRKVPGDKKTMKFVGAADNITAQERLEGEVRLREQLLSGVLCFLTVDLEENRIMETSRKLDNVKNRRFSQFAQSQIAELVLEECRSQILEDLSLENWKKDYQNGQYYSQKEYRGKAKDGQVIWMECDRRLDLDEQTGHLIAYLLIRDIDNRKQQELMLKKEADRDYLTGLFNRRSGTEKINRLLTKNQDGVHAFVILDLDNFKSLNDNLGHQMGDQALKDVAEILAHHFRPYDVICRLAGDEFVVFLLNIPLEIIGRNIESLLKKLCLTYQEKETSVRISASAGVAVFPTQGKSFEELYEKADQAMYQAKRKGKGSYEVYGDDQ